MELKDAILQRKSIRGYEDKPVPEDKLHAVLEAARMAPSGANRQPWKFVVVRDSEKRQHPADRVMSLQRPLLSQRLEQCLRI